MIFGLYTATIMPVLHTYNAVTLLTPTYQQTALTKQKRRPENRSSTKIRSLFQITKSLSMVYSPKALLTAIPTCPKHHSTTRYHPWTRL